MASNLEMLFDQVVMILVQLRIPVYFIYRLDFENLYNKNAAELHSHIKKQFNIGMN